MPVASLSVDHAVAYYRLYFMNKHSGHIDRFEEFEAIDDESAIERADRHAALAPFELWSGAKKVYRLACVTAGGQTGGRLAAG
jgi:hypothetical protein